MLIVIIEGIIKFICAIPVWFSDFFKWLRRKGWREFDRWGLHLFVGKFGAGKTTTMVSYAYRLCCKYPQLSIVTNLTLINFPKKTQIFPLKSADDILKAPPSCLVLIDEIGTIFNSRDFASGGKSVPKILFQYLCQCRKRKMMIYGTTQRWNFLDKQLRDITDTVYVTRTIFAHPFSRLAFVLRYDAHDYDNSYANPLLPLPLMSGNVYIQTDKIRGLFTTEQLIAGLLEKRAKDFLSDEEILLNQGEAPAVFQGEVDKKLARKYKRGRKLQR